MLTMRHLIGGLAVAGGIVSVALAARYGWKGADTTADAIINGTVFGLIALFAFILDGAAVRLWFTRHKGWAVGIGVIAFLAFVVTVTNSLGAIASRDDGTLAQRTKVANAYKDNRAELARLEKALAALGSYTPVDEEAVKAAKRAADTASTSRKAECEKRGTNCRAREIDEQAAATALATTTTAKSTTDRGRKGFPIRALAMPVAPDEMAS
jgi:hypothetical protein